MIVLPIGKDEEDDTPQEWSLLELNGEILGPKILPEDDEDMMELGKVVMDKQGVPIMTIGTHELKGKVEDLKQPFVVMKLRKRTNEDNNDDNGGINSTVADKRRKLESSGNMNMDVKEGYTIAGIVKSKMLFDRYPKSIMR
jgi:hypothetical protein